MRARSFTDRIRGKYKWQCMPGHLCLEYYGLLPLRSIARSRMTLFADANTHTTRAGAELNAACVIEGIKAFSDHPLAAYFSGKAAAVEK